MSASTSVQETLPLEGANPCHFFVMYEDASAHDQAMEVCGGIMGRFGHELAFAFSFWKFKDLEDPAMAHWAAEAVARADIILFSLPARDLSQQLASWLETCARVRTKANGALAVAIMEPHDQILVMETLLTRLQFIAKRMRMDFLPLLPLTAGAGHEKPADSFANWLSEDREETGSHWGLNE